MSCKSVQNDLMAFLTGDLDDSRKSALEAHLKSCPVCQKQYQSMVALWSDLGQLPEEEPDVNLRARFDAMLNTYKEAEQSHPQTVQAGFDFKSWFRGLWSSQTNRRLGFAFALLLVGFFVGRWFNPAAGDTQVTQLRQEVEKLNQMMAVALLERSSPSDRLMGVSYSSRLERPDDSVVAVLLHTLENDKNINVRLAAVDALASMSELPSVREGLAAALPEQDSPIIQIALIDALVLTRNRGSVASLQKLQRIERLAPAVDERLQWAVQELK